MTQGTEGAWEGRREYGSTEGREGVRERVDILYPLPVFSARISENRVSISFLEWLVGGPPEAWGLLQVARAQREEEDWAEEQQSKTIKAEQLTSVQVG